MKFLDKFRNLNIKKILPIIVIIIVLLASILILRNFISIPFLSNTKKTTSTKQTTQAKNNTSTEEKIEQEDKKKEIEENQEINEINNYGSSNINVNENWKGSINGMKLNIGYDTKSKSFIGIVKNVTNYTIKDVIIKINLKKDDKVVALITDTSIKKLSKDDSKVFKLDISSYDNVKDSSYDTWNIYAISTTSTETINKARSIEDFN